MLELVFTIVAIVVVLIAMISIYEYEKSKVLHVAYITKNNDNSLVYGSILVDRISLVHTPTLAELESIRNIIRSDLKIDKSSDVAIINLIVVRKA